MNIPAAEERTEYHNVVTWDRLAEICGQFLGKGQQVAIEGRIQTRSWDDEKSIRHWKTEIVASNVEMLSGRKKKDYEAQSAAEALEAPARAPGRATRTTTRPSPVPGRFRGRSPARRSRRLTAVPGSRRTGVRSPGARPARGSIGLSRSPPYSFRRLIPVAAATRRAASPRATPARRAARPPPGRRPRRRRRPQPPRFPARPRRRSRTRPWPGSRRSGPARPARPALPRTIVSWSLVSSRQTAAEPIAAAGRRQVGQRRRNPAGRLVQDRGPLVGGNPGQALAALAAGSRQEALERPARAGDPAGDHRGQDRRRAGDRHDRARPPRPTPGRARRPDR